MNKIVTQLMVSVLLVILLVSSGIALGKDIDKSNPSLAIYPGQINTSDNNVTGNISVTEIMPTETGVVKVQTQAKTTATPIKTPKSPGFEFIVAMIGILSVIFFSRRR